MNHQAAIIGAFDVDTHGTESSNRRQHILAFQQPIDVSNTFGQSTKNYRAM